MLPRKTAISCIFVSSVRESELFMILKLIVPSSPVLPPEYHSLLETPQSPSVNILLYVYKF